MSFNYRFEPPHINDFINEPNDFEDEILDYEGQELKYQIEEHLCEEKYQNWRIQEFYERRDC